MVERFEPQPGEAWAYRARRVDDLVAVEVMKTGTQVLERFAAEKVIRHGPSARRTAYERLSAELKRQRKAVSAADFAAFLDSDRSFHNVTVEDAGNSIIGGF